MSGKKKLHEIVVVVLVYGPL